MNFCVSSDSDLACIGIETWIASLHFQESTQAPSPIRDSTEYAVIAARLWRLLSVEYANCHFKVSQLMFELQKIAPDACEAVLADNMLHPQSPDYAEGYRR